MGMEITKSFVVKAPAAAVWDFLTDPYRVGRCLPGAAITDKVDDQTYTGTITIKVGPVTASYRGKMKFERLDPVAMEADIAASGQETKGKGGADMRMKSRVVDKGPTLTTALTTRAFVAAFLTWPVRKPVFDRRESAMSRVVAPWFATTTPETELSK